MCKHFYSFDLLFRAEREILKILRFLASLEMRDGTKMGAIFKQLINS